jgi:hypothetical protein
MIFLSIKILTQFLLERIHLRPREEQVFIRNADNYKQNLNNRSKSSLNDATFALFAFRNFFVRNNS